MRLKTGDRVVVIAGKDRGKEGTISRTFPKEDKVIVEGVNFIKKHVKSDGNNPGAIESMEAPIHVSNVMLVDPKTNERTRVGYTTNKDNKKIRVTKKSNESLD